MSTLTKQPKQEKKWLVQSGEEVVELHGSGLSFERAKEMCEQLNKLNLKGVRYRREDAIHPTWPMEFDYEKEERLEAQRASEIAESCRDKEAADRIGGHPWSNC